MKRIAFLPIAILFVSLSCTKLQAPQTDEFYGDEPLAIEFAPGAVMTTKADATITPEVFASEGFHYGILAVDNLGERHPSVNGIGAANVPDGEGRLHTSFLDGLHFYPIISERGYTFYGYRYSEEDVFEVPQSGVLQGLPMGYCDIIWAKAQTDAPGFNAKYIREGGEKPKLVFSHLTSRFVFNVKAIDSHAEETMAGNVKITGIKLGGVSLEGNFDILEGTLTAGQETGYIPVETESDEDFYPLAAGAQFGNPLFILPQSNIEMVITMETPDDPAFEYRQLLSYQGALDAFQAGWSYKFTITLRSNESIDIIAEITPWEEAEGDEIVIG